MRDDASSKEARDWRRRLSKLKTRQVFAIIEGRHAQSESFEASGSLVMARGDEEITH